MLFIVGNAKNQATTESDQATTVGGQATTDGATTDGGQATTDGGQATTDGGQATTDGGQATTVDVDAGGGDAGQGGTGGGGEGGCTGDSSESCEGGDSRQANNITRTSRFNFVSTPNLHQMTSFCDSLNSDTILLCLLNFDPFVSLDNYAKAHACVDYAFNCDILLCNCAYGVRTAQMLV